MSVSGFALSGVRMTSARSINEVSNPSHAAWAAKRCTSIKEPINTLGAIDGKSANRFTVTG